MKRKRRLMWEKNDLFCVRRTLHEMQTAAAVYRAGNIKWTPRRSQQNVWILCTVWAASGGLGLNCIPRTVLVDSCYVIGATSENMFNLVACKWSWFTLITQCQYFLKSPSNSFLIVTSTDHRVVSLHNAELAKDFTSEREQLHDYWDNSLSFNTLFTGIDHVTTFRNNTSNGNPPKYILHFKTDRINTWSNNDEGKSDGTPRPSQAQQVPINIIV